MIITTGVKAQELDRLVIWKTDRGDHIALAGWPIAEAIKITYQNLVKASSALDPELGATLMITDAFEAGLKLMQIGFSPNPDQRAEIRMQIVGPEKF